jgi:pyruvate/2-oxoglutarate dehydrogenase complex dihydrolipoamide acyltransferase (E2) component
MVDGAPAARFLQCVKQFVENPEEQLGPLAGC